MNLLLRIDNPLNGTQNEDGMILSQGETGSLLLTLSSSGEGTVLRFFELVKKFIRV